MLAEHSNERPSSVRPASRSPRASFRWPIRHLCVRCQSPVDTRVFQPPDHRQRAATRLLSVGNLLESQRPSIFARRDEDAAGQGQHIRTRHRRGRRLARMFGAAGARSGDCSKCHILGPPRTGGSRSEDARGRRLLSCPSPWETQGCVLLEAMASGLPSVATRVGGTPEVVDDRRARMVEPRSASALAEGISQLPGRVAHTTVRRCTPRRWTGTATQQSRRRRPRCTRSRWVA